MRFVHTADVHLDTSFAGRSDDVRRRLRDASRDAFRRTVELAIREKVHALLVAGDLFDSERLSFATERFLLAEADRLATHGISLVYATGNHDPGSPDAGPRPLPWPANVEVVAEGTPRRIAIRDREGRTVGFVTAAGHASEREFEDLSRRFPRPPGGTLPEVAMLHTQVHASPGSAQHDPYAPSELGYLSRSGYHYWALGHVHIHQVLAENPPVVYPGNPQGRTHTDTGPRGACLVDLTDPGAPRIALRPLAPIRWETLVVDRLEDADSLDRLERRIASSWQAVRAGDPGAPGVEWMVRVVLTGPSPLWRELRREEDREALSSELRDMIGALDVTVLADATHPVVDVGEHRRRADVLGETLRRLAAVLSGEESLQTDPTSLAGLASDDATAVPAYVRRILEGSEGELTARLLGLDRSGT